MRELAVSIAADGSLVILLIIAAITIGHQLYQKRSLRPLHYVAMSGLTSLMIAKCVSVIYQPGSERPFVEAGKVAGAAFVNNPGFPSDHAVLGAVLVAAVYGITRQKKVSLAMLMILLVMDVGRVVALVHTPLDVIAGTIFGLLGAIWYTKKDNE